MVLITDNAFDNFQRSFQEFLEATDLSRQDKATRLASQIDIISQTRDGLSFLYEKSVELDQADFFKGTAWNEPDNLVPSLVKGTIKSGHPNSSFEIISNLRMLSYANGRAQSAKVSQKEAQVYLEEVVIQNMEFALKEPTEETRNVMTERELKKAFNLFGFILSEADLEGMHNMLAEEIMLICQQRPVVTRKAREIIHLIDRKMDLDPTLEADQELLFYVNAIVAPTKGSKQHKSLADYQNMLSGANTKLLESEAGEMGHYLGTTGLVSQYHALLLTHLLKHKPELIPLALDLSDTGAAEFKKHEKLIDSLIDEVVSVNNSQCIYGMARMLNRSLFSRRPVRVGLENLRKIKLNPQVEQRILHSEKNPNNDVTALQYLIGATIRILGQPLGVGQGNNPTCQSARGISMWSQHAPAKLIDMIITVATQNNLIMRFENTDLESIKLGKGLLGEMDYNLDAVSVVLVPHLDKIYNEMMKRAAIRGEDPHKWVNPAMYGQWIQIGFASCYDYFTNAITDYKGFIRTFYASFHIEYNGGQHMVYPNPVGIYITSSKGEMVGFHAISLVRVDKDPTGEIRAYFLNPNNEGRQNWGQNIKPSVFGHGEKHGESSLPFHQFAARIYAFHYNSLETKMWSQHVPDGELAKVEELARSSWGKSYTWNDQVKLW